MGITCSKSEVFLVSGMIEWATKVLYPSVRLAYLWETLTGLQGENACDFAVHKQKSRTFLAI